MLHADRLSLGGSDFGTLAAPTLPDFLTNNPLPQGFPWGDRGAATTNPYEQSPTTGVIRAYDFTISRGFIAPDGVNKSVLLINNQFPAPQITANWGDTFQITVHNQITGPEEGTGLHWHGILQRATPWYDGVPGVNQCPIAPGKTFTYTFKADLYGTSWYHSHYSAQYAGGLFGPMIIYGPKNYPYQVDVGPVMVSDWYHTEYFELVEKVMTPNVPPAPPKSQNNLINGKMDYDCSKAPAGVSCKPNAGLSKFKFQTGKTHRLRLINAGSDGLQKISIDGHSMKVIANDFVPVRPYDTDVVTLGIGQRTDVIVKANMTSGSAVWLRAFLPDCVGTATQPLALAAIYYDKADTSKTPNSTSNSNLNTACVNDPLEKTTPFFPFPATSNPATTTTINIIAGKNSTGHNLWFMNGVSFRANYDHPVFLLANAGNTSYPYDPQWNVYNYGTNNSVRLILNNPIPVAHPMHLHGHNFNVLASGTGTWDGTITHIQNTQRRDVHMLPGAGYMVVQYNTDNPGVWPFHCHIAWHVSAGLYVNLMEQVPKIAKKVVPQTVAQTCRDWADYSGHTVVAQIDSGL